MSHKKKICAHRVQPYFRKCFYALSSIQSMKKAKNGSMNGSEGEER